MASSADAPCWRSPTCLVSCLRETILKLTRSALNRCNDMHYSGHAKPPAKPPVKPKRSPKDRAMSLAAAINVANQAFWSRTKK
jgi:hypothetical protein